MLGDPNWQTTGGGGLSVSMKRLPVCVTCMH